MKLFHLIILLGCFVHSALCVPYAGYIAMAFSIAGVALVIPHYIVFKNHLRLLDLLQLCFLFSFPKILSASTQLNFSNLLNYSWGYFIPNYWTPLAISPTSYLMFVGNLLSWGACVLGSIAIAWIVTLIVRCNNQTNWRFSDVFVLFKGLIRWMYLGLTSVSVMYVISTSDLYTSNPQSFQASYK